MKNIHRLPIDCLRAIVDNHRYSPKKADKERYEICLQEIARREIMIEAFKNNKVIQLRRVS
jgi:hypothetical protein